MQVFANVATEPVKKESKASGKAYWEWRICESQRGQDDSPTWFTVRRMSPEDPRLVKGG